MNVNRKTYILVNVILWYNAVLVSESGKHPCKTSASKNHRAAASNRNTSQTWKLWRRPQSSCNVHCDYRLWRLRGGCILGCAGSGRESCVKKRQLVYFITTTEIHTHKLMTRPQHLWKVWDERWGKHKRLNREWDQDLLRESLGRERSWRRHWFEICKMLFTRNMQRCM